MTQAELQAKLDELLALPGETEWVEFKEAKNNFDSDELGKYVSALSNEANLKGQSYGWLVFGVQDRPLQVVGTNYRQGRPALDKLKQDVAKETTCGLTFHEIHELNTSQGRVVLFQIPAAPPGMPTAWKNHFYGRNGESRGALSLQEIEQIRAQAGVRPRAVKGNRKTPRFRNPYNFSHVAKGQLFKGRNREIDELLANVDNGTHTAVFGLQRVGKTSLVKHAMTDGLRKRPELKKELLYAEIDFQRTRYSKYRDLFDVFLKAIAKCFQSDRETQRAGNTLNTFEKEAERPGLRDRRSLFALFADTLGELVDAARGKKIVLFLDEFSEWCRLMEENEQATKAPGGHRLRAVRPHEALVDVALMQFFSSLLRSDELCNRLVFIFAMRPFMADFDRRRNLQILKLCRPITLGYLDEAAAKALIAEPIRHFPSIGTEAVDYLYRLTAGHPYLIQYLLTIAVDEAVSDQKSINLQRVEAVERRLVSEGAGYEGVFNVLDSDYSIEEVFAPRYSACGKGLLSLAAKLGTDRADRWADKKRLVEEMGRCGCRREETERLLSQLVDAKILEEKEVEGHLCFRMVIPLLQKRYLAQNFYLKHFSSLNDR